MTPELRFQQASGEDAERLADLRVEAMRPSLEAVGRFDPIRARERFLSGFDPLSTTLILECDQLLGFYVVREAEDHILLDHLYLDAETQGAGLGSEVIKRVKALARTTDRPVRLMALNGSPANAFYMAHGFEVLGQDSLDTRYEWRPNDMSRPT